MFIERYEYVTGDVDTGEALEIGVINRSKYMTTESIKNFTSMFEIPRIGTTALLYAGGPASHHSDIRNVKGLAKDGNIAIKSQLGMNAYTVAKAIGGIDYLSINTNTCASSMFSIHEASKLVEEYDNVIIYAEDLTDATQRLLFSQLNIDLVCGDAIAMVHLTASKTPNSIAEITDTAWCWNEESSPMVVSASGYRKVINKLDVSSIDLVKPHGSGTSTNDTAEDSVIAAVLPEATVYKYKSRIGHTQGASTIVELGMLLDEVDSCNCLCLASGLGGFYGACIVVKG